MVEFPACRMGDPQPWGDTITNFPITLVDTQQIPVAHGRCIGCPLADERNLIARCTSVIVSSAEYPSGTAVLMIAQSRLNRGVKELADKKGLIVSTASVDRTLALIVLFHLRARCYRSIEKMESDPIL